MSLEIWFEQSSVWSLRLNTHYTRKYCQNPSLETWTFFMGNAYSNAQKRKKNRLLFLLINHIFLSFFFHNSGKFISKSIVSEEFPFFLIRYIVSITSSKDKLFSQKKKREKKFLFWSKYNSLYDLFSGKEN